MNFRQLFLILSALLCLGAAPALLEDHPEVPEQLPGVVVIGAEQLLALVEGGHGAVIDSRKSSDFKLGSTPDALNCPVTSGHHLLDEAEVTQTVEDLKRCPAGILTLEKGKPVATFCNGLRCWRSAKLALALRQLGFLHVHWYRLGMNDWRAKGLPME
ncbi:MAG: rhodanese-like domain-containing protein [Magnetococcus sp. MYC-9]